MKEDVAALKINGGKLWEAIIVEGKEIVFVHDHTREIMRRFIENRVPQTLDGLADLPASADNITQATLAYLRGILDDSDLLGSLADAVAEDSGVPHAADAIFEVMTEALEDAVDQREAMIIDFPAFLASEGITEMAALLLLGMDEDDIPLIESRELTIGKLLLDRPSVILDFSKG